MDWGSESFDKLSEGSESDDIQFKESDGPSREQDSGVALRAALVKKVSP